MAESKPLNKELALETTIANLFGAFTYKAEQLILQQTFKQPLEFDVFQFWNSPLGHEIASLSASQLCLAFSSGKNLVPKEIVALVAREHVGLLRSEISKPIDLSAVFSCLSQERQEYWKTKSHQVQETGLLEWMLGGLCLFLDNVANEAHVATNDTPLSSEERSVILLYLVLGWNLVNILVMMASSGDEDRLRLQNYQRPEYEALVEYVRGQYGWGGDRNKALELARDSLRPRLDRKLERLWISDPRHKGPESWNEPHNDERQSMIIGLHEGLEWATKRNLVNILPDIPSRKLSNALVRAATNNLIDAIRVANRQTGVGVIPKWLQEGKTRDEIEVLKQAPKQVPDYEIRTPCGEPSSVLERAVDKEGFKYWADEEREAERCAVLWGRIEPLLQKAQLTPRRQLVLVRSFRDKKQDEEIAVELKERFGKKVGMSQVRKLKHEALKQVKSAAEK